MSPYRPRWWMRWRRSWGSPSPARAPQSRCPSRSRCAPRRVPPTWPTARPRGTPTSTSTATSASRREWWCWRSSRWSMWARAGLDWRTWSQVCVTSIWRRSYKQRRVRRWIMLLSRTEGMTVGVCEPFICRSAQYLCEMSDDVVNLLQMHTHFSKPSGLHSCTDIIDMAWLYVDQLPLLLPRWSYPE